ncbi:MAG: hypothetical protein ACT4PO_16525 [Actinomycetota bacterium]
MAGPYAPSDSRNYVGIGKQTLRGTGVAPTVFAAYVDAVDLDHGVALNKILEAGAAGQVTFTEKGGHMPSGGFTFLARPSITSRLQAFVLGADAISGIGPYTHVLTSDFATDYQSVEQNLADESVERFVDCVVAELVYTIDPDNPVLRVKGTWLGGVPAHQGAVATAETYETELPWLLSEGVFTVDGAAAADVKGFTFTSRMRISLEKIALVTPKYIVKVGEDAEVEFTEFQTAITSTGYRKVNYGTTSGTAASASATSGAFIAQFDRGAGAAARQLKINIPTIDYESAVYTPLDPGAGEGTKVVYSAFGRKVAGAALVTVTGITNDSAAYV